MRRLAALTLLVTMAAAPVAAEPMTAGERQRHILQIREIKAHPGFPRKWPRRSGPLVQEAS